MRTMEYRRPSTIVMWASIALAVVACSTVTRPSSEPRGINDVKVAERLSPPELLRISRSSATTHAERDHFLYLPEGYRTRASETWPVLLFLHGNGERGDAKGDLDFLLKNGPLYEAWIQKRALPFILVVPQLPMYGQDEHAPYLKHRSRQEIPVRLAEGVPAREPRFETPEPMKGALAEPLPQEETPYGPPMGWPELENDLIGILDDVLARFRGDPDRQYLTGLSYGGFGTWYLASRHPERFAAIAPVVGYAHPDLIPSLAAARMPIWCFAGGRDDVVPAKYFYAGFNRLEALGHKSARLTIEVDSGHDVWSRVYAGRDVYDWLLAHRRVTPVSQ
ncbi:MAG: prolyl oligopeptidase family serine peptidase [Polyangiaceae bacterium]